jgi:hypothetical protein
MNFTQAQRDEAIRVLKAAKVEASAGFTGLPDSVFEVPPFSDIEDFNEQLALFNLVRLSLGSAARAAAEQPPPKPGGTSATRPGESTSDAVDLKLIGAPFRFVPLADVVAPAEDKVAEASFNQSLPDPAGFSGTIRVRWAIETPLLIGQSVEDQPWDRPAIAGLNGAGGQINDIAIPMSIARSRYVIPGASLKGLMRASIETFAFARLGDGNHHHRYGLRDFEHPKFNSAADERLKRLDWENIGSGFLRKAREGDPLKETGDSDYVVELCSKRMIMMEHLLPELVRGSVKAAPGDPGFAVWARAYRGWLSKGLGDKYQSAGMGSPTMPDFSKVRRFDVQADSPFTTFQSGGREGILVFAGKSYHDKPKKGKTPQEDADNEAKLAREFEDTLSDQLLRVPVPPGSKKPRTHRRQEYVFFREPERERRVFRVSERVWQQFRRLHSRPGKTAFKPDGSWKVLEPVVERNREIPVFFTGLPTDQAEKAPNPFELGLTRLFKIAHEYSVADVIKRKHPKHEKAPPGTQGALDIAEALFGFVYDEAPAADARTAPWKVARKGRASFGFARLAQGPAPSLSPVYEGVMMGPRASFAPYYMQGVIRDWSEPNAGLAGRKRYFPRFATAQLGTAATTLGAAIGATSGNEKPEARSRMVFLQGANGQPLVFESEIRLRNVSAFEVGALLWALTHGGQCEPFKPFRHMIGRGKPFGAGQTRVVDIDLSALCAHGPAGRPNLAKAEPWELTTATAEKWVSGENPGLGPFLRTFDAAITKAVPDWAASAPVQGFLGAASLAEGAKIASDGAKGQYQKLTAFNDIRSSVKLRAKPKPPAIGQPTSFLSAPKASATRPYNQRRG